MSGRARETIAPLYLLCCLILGSAQNNWALMVVQLLGLALLAWSALEPFHEPLGRPARELLMIAGAALIIVVLQLVPLPLTLWQHLGGRQGLATDYRMLGLRISALPLSLTPYETLNDALRLIPPLAIVCAIVRLRAYRPIWLAAALLAGTGATVVLAAIHVLTNDFATPIFSAASQIAVLLVTSLPFAVALFTAGRGVRRRQSVWMMAILALLAAAVAFISMATIQQQDHGHVIGPSVGGRAEVLRTTARAAGDFMPFGSGLGSFQSAYRFSEDPRRVSTGNVIHAHNDYLEIALEMGLPGILLLIGFLAWWIAVSVCAWREADTLTLARAAAIASGLILFDSLMDSPLRTASVSIVFAMCLALLVDGRVRSRPELRPTRHVVLE